MLGIISRIRILPLTIFFVSLMLTVKVGNIWKGVEVVINSSISVAEAQAQQSTAPATTPPATAAPVPTMPGDQPAADQAATKSAADSSTLLGNDPTLLTQAEIDLLQQLAARREELDKRDREVNVREAMLKAAESRINKKVEELKVFQDTISKLIKTYDDQQSAKMQSLVKIYENMKPNDAARIFEKLQMDTLLSVVERMKERKLAAIMAKMDPAKATEITVELSRLRKLPSPG